MVIIMIICVVVCVNEAWGLDYSQLRIIPGRGIPTICELGMTLEEIKQLTPDACVTKDGSFVFIPHLGITVSLGQMSYKDCTVITFDFKGEEAIDGSYYSECGKDGRGLKAIKPFPGMFPPFHSSNEITLEKVEEFYGVHSRTFSNFADSLHIESQDSLSPTLVRLKDNDITILQYLSLGFSVFWTGTNLSATSLQVYRPLDMANGDEHNEGVVPNGAQDIFVNRVRYVAWRTFEGSKLYDKKRKWFISSMRYHAKYNCKEGHLKNVWTVLFSDASENKFTLCGRRGFIMDAENFKVLGCLGED